MISTIHRFVLTGGMLCAAIVATRADVLPIDPFTGDHTDTFNRFHNTMAVQVLDVFDNTAMLSNLTTDGAIKVEWSSSLGGDLVVPISGMMVGQLGIGRWDFDLPAVRFGGWFENNSHADDATLYFYDEKQNLFGSTIATVPVDGGAWVWNGWESDVPFTRIEVVGNGLINGFIWYENMQVSYVPEPASAALLGVCAWLASHRRRSV